jgi:hypothetical protein
MPRKPTSSASDNALANPAEARVRGQEIAEIKMAVDPLIAAGEEREAETGRFLPGNRFWAARSTFGPKPMFTNGGDLWTACVEYFEWVDANPLYSDQLVTFQGKATHEPVEKMRAMTLAGLCLFLDITTKAWRLWKANRQDLAETIERVEMVLYAQKFAGAAADLLNANIIARDLGLADKSELTGKDGGPVELKEMSDIEKARRIAFALGRAIQRLPASETIQHDPCIER